MTTPSWTINQYLAKAREHADNTAGILDLIAKSTDPTRPTINEYFIDTMLKGAAVEANLSLAYSQMALALERWQN